MAIYLIRHGETAANRARVVQLPATPLSERGLAQADRLAARLSGEGIERVLCSDLARAVMTAECVARATGAPLETDAVLQERNFGEIRGTAYTDLAENPFGLDYEPPGGETWQAFHRRVDRAWQRIRALALAGAGHLAVVTHGLVCHSLAARHLELPAVVSRPGPNGPLLQFGNTALSILHGPDPWRAEVFACTAHLEDELAADAAAVGGL